MSHIDAHLDSIRRDVTTTVNVVNEANPRLVVKEHIDHDNADAETFTLYVDGWQRARYKTRNGVTRALAKLTP